MIPKPGKPPKEVGSCRPISLLPITSKIFEKSLLKRLHPIVEENKNHAGPSVWISAEIHHHLTELQRSYEEV
jgi:hypothetical protein